MHIHVTGLMILVLSSSRKYPVSIHPLRTREQYFLVGGGSCGISEAKTKKLHCILSSVCFANQNVIFSTISHNLYHHDETNITNPWMPQPLFCFPTYIQDLDGSLQISLKATSNQDKGFLQSSTVMILFLFTQCHTCISLLIVAQQSSDQRWRQQMHRWLQRHFRTNTEYKTLCSEA